MGEVPPARAAKDGEAMKRLAQFDFPVAPNKIMSALFAENCNYEVTPVVKQKVERLTLDEKISLVELLWNDIHRSNSRIKPDEDESNYVEKRLK